MEEEHGVPEVQAGAHGGMVQGDNGRAFIPTITLNPRRLTFAL